MAQARWRRVGGAGLVLASLSWTASQAWIAPWAGAQQTTVPAPTSTSAPAETTTTSTPPSSTSTPASTTSAPPSSSSTTATSAATSTSRSTSGTGTTAGVATTARPASAAVTSGPTSSARPATSTTRARATTTVAEGPQSSVIVPAGSAPAADGGQSRTVVYIVVALLGVVGLLVATLTWRYWWFTDPRRGYVRSRAVLARGATLDDAEGELVRVLHPDDRALAGAGADDGIGDGTTGRRPAPSRARNGRSDTPGSRRSRVR